MFAAVVLGVAIGIGSAFAPVIALALVTVVALVMVLARSTVKAEIVAAAFWITFCAYETVWASVTITGLFYPFYAAFVATVIGNLVRGGYRLRLDLVVPYVVFLLLVAVSFIGFTEAVSFEVAQRVLAYLFGLLVLLQVGSKQGVRPLLLAAIGAALVVAVWVVVNAVQGGFAYRGGVDVDQNAAAFFIGLGLAAALALALTRSWFASTPFGFAVIAVGLGVMLYGSLLLASRGMTIALAVAMLVLVVRVVARRPARLMIVVWILVAVVASTALPGGDELIGRFSGERVETGGSRVPIWIAVLEGFADGDVRELLLGHGFDASKDLVRREFGSLTSTHNAFLQVLYEFGVLGFAAFVWLHAVLLVRGWTMADAPGGLVLGLSAFLIGANLTANAPDGFLYWTSIGFVLAVATWWAPAPARARRMAAS